MDDGNAKRLLSFKVIAGNLNSEKYITLLAHNVVIIIKLNYRENWFLQENNASVHKSKKVKDFMIKSGLSVLEWPPKSPDLNIVEDCWKTISEPVYDGKQFTCKDELVHKITAVMNHLNRSKREKVVDLYNVIRSRLIYVLQKRRFV